MMNLIRTSADDPAFLRLTGELSLELRERYGALQDQYEPHNNVENAAAVIIAEENGEPVGCGCFRVVDETTIEIKRMYVRPARRGRGIAARILERLEQTARSRGFSAAILETGIRQPEAVRLYNRHGYRQIDNYGPYAGMTESVCMRKDI
jgi:GNAT superfamily N-acetyltransferase